MGTGSEDVRFIAVRATARSREEVEAYLYGYAQIVGVAESGVIIEIRSDNPDFHANYQAGRLQSGAMGTAIHRTFTGAAGEFEGEAVADV